LVSRRVYDCQVGVELSTSLSRHPPRGSLARHSVAAVQLGAVLEPRRTPRPPMPRLLLLLLGRFHLGLWQLHCLLLMPVRLFMLVRLRPVDVKRS